MNLLGDHMKGTADILSGYTTGRLIVDLTAKEVSLQEDSGQIISLTSHHVIEVRNGNQYEQVTISQALAAVTAEGWPGCAGLYCRVRLPHEESRTE